MRVLDLGDYRATLYMHGPGDERVHLDRLSGYTPSEKEAMRLLAKRVAELEDELEAQALDYKEAMTRFDI